MREFVDGCRRLTSFSTPGVEEKMTWLLEDDIRWIEERLRELELGEPCEASLSAVECRVWLARYRDSKSYVQIAKNECRRFWNTATGKRKNQRGVSFIRRGVGRVNVYLTTETSSPREREQLEALCEALSNGLLPIHSIEGVEIGSEE